MNKQIGGRGNKAPYETVMVRCPVPIKLQVQQLIEDYRNSLLDEETTSDKSQSSAEIEQCLKLVYRFIDDRNLSEKMNNPAKYRNVSELVQLIKWLKERSES